MHTNRNKNAIPSRPARTHSNAHQAKHKSDAKWISTHQASLSCAQHPRRPSVRLLSADAVGFSVTPFRCRRRCGERNSGQRAHTHGSPGAARVFVSAASVVMTDGLITVVVWHAPGELPTRTGKLAVMSANCDDAHLSGPHKSAAQRHTRTHTCNIQSVPGSICPTSECVKRLFNGSACRYLEYTVIIL